MLAPLLPIGNSTCSLSASEQIQNRKEWFVIFAPFIHAKHNQENPSLP